MPRVTLTEAARRVEAERQRQERVRRIVYTAASARGYDMKKLSAKAGLEYQSLCRWLRGAAVMPLAGVVKIAEVLKLDDQTRAALMGSKTRCRFEAEYREDAG